MLKGKVPLPLRLGATAGNALAVLCLVYALVLVVGLVTLPSPGLPIQNPWFTIMEVLILVISPAMVAFTIGLHAWVPSERKGVALLAVLFMGMCAVVTSCVHFAILTLSRQQAFAAGDWATLVFSFKWPSLVYALDILAWDIFFPLSALCAAVAVQGAGLAKLARSLLFGSSMLAFIGLGGVPFASMNVRNIGIIGYVLLFPIAAALLAIVFTRQGSQGAA